MHKPDKSTQCNNIIGITNGRGNTWTKDPAEPEVCYLRITKEIVELLTQSVHPHHNYWHIIILNQVSNLRDWLCNNV